MVDGSDHELSYNVSQNCLRGSLGCETLLNSIWLTTKFHNHHNTNILTPMYFAYKTLFFFRNHYDNTTWCFCQFDHWCNGGQKTSFSILMLFLGSLLHRLFTWYTTHDLLPYMFLYFRTNIDEVLFQNFHFLLLYY